MRRNLADERYSRHGNFSKLPPMEKAKSANIKSFCARFRAI
jgi:hypothetical protein